MGIDFALSEGGKISGSVSDSDSTSPIANANGVHLYDASGALLSTKPTDALGQFQFAGLTSGSYLLRAEFDGFLGELYDDIPCPPGCNVLTGTPIAVGIGETVSGIDFALTAGGSITGVITESTTPAILANLGNVVLHDAGGSTLASTTTNAFGFYSFTGLTTGSYYVRTDMTDYYDEVFDDMDCEGGCDATSGSPVAVALGSTTSGIDFALSTGGVITGTVTEGGLGTPVANASSLELFDDQGTLVAEKSTDEGGVYRFAVLSTGTYFVKTHLSGYGDQLYDGIPCAPGCDVTMGTPVSVVFDLTSSGIDFVVGGPSIFADGFETGNASAWSASEP